MLYDPPAVVSRQEIAADDLHVLGTALADHRAQLCDVARRSHETPESTESTCEKRINHPRTDEAIRSSHKDRVVLIDNRTLTILAHRYGLERPRVLPTG
jgi:hypothetical protein